MTAGREPSAALTVADLDAYIGSQHIVSGVGFSVAGTGVTALLGRNGVGKTTTLRAVMGLVRRTGRIELGGRRIDNLATHAVARSGIGYVPENREVFGGLTVAENLSLAARGRPVDLEPVHDLFPDLRRRARQAAGSLSGGQQQMLALARVLVNNNAVLLIDEPTKGLAPKVVDEVTDALGVAAQRTPVLLVEQDLDVVGALAHTVVVLADGRVAHSGGCREFLADTELVRSLLGVGRRVAVR